MFMSQLPPHSAVLVKRAREEWEENGVILVDTEMQLHGNGIEPDKLIEIFEEEKQDNG
jgi:hypothetical protein